MATLRATHSPRLPAYANDKLHNWQWRHSDGSRRHGISRAADVTSRRVSTPRMRSKPLPLLQRCCRKYWFLRACSPTPTIRCSVSQLPGSRQSFSPCPRLASSRSVAPMTAAAGPVRSASFSRPDLPDRSGVNRGRVTSAFHRGSKRSAHLGVLSNGFFPKRT